MDTNLHPDTLKHLTWFVMGMVMDYALKMDPAMLTTKGAFGRTYYDNYVNETIEKMIKTVKVGDSRYLDGSCSDLQCEIGLQVLKRFSLHEYDPKTS
jgi:hypothetical protein